MSCGCHRGGNDCPFPQRACSPSKRKLRVKSPVLQQGRKWTPREGRAGEEAGLGERQEGPQCGRALTWGVCRSPDSRNAEPPSLRAVVGSGVTRDVPSEVCCGSGWGVPCLLRGQAQSTVRPRWLRGTDVKQRGRWHVDKL